MQNIIKLCGLLLLFAFTACSEDDFNSKTDENKRAFISFTINVPTHENVNNSRAVSEAESEISELALILFEKTSGRREYIELTNLVGSTPTNMGYRTYTCDAIETLSGSYKMYAIANWSSTFAGITDLDALTQTEEQIQALYAENAGFNIALEGDNRIPMSYYSEDVIIYPSEDTANTTKLAIKLRRAVAHIEFEFKNGTTANKPSFTPQKYSIYNLPSKANLLDKRFLNEDANNILGNQVAEYSHIENITFTGNTLEFLMLENAQANVTNNGAALNANQRDAWNHDVNNIDFKTRKFTYAPENSTFVVVEGTYVDTEYSGSVRYIIHLGNFSQPNSDDKNYSNFNVSRNEYHKYVVTVNGVNSIDKEADVENPEDTPGYEGEITKGKNNFVLDAHYETVMIKFAQSYIKETGNEVRIRSPKTGMSYITYKIDELDDQDFGWIQFQKPVGSRAANLTFPEYAGLGYNSPNNTNDGRYWGTIKDLVKTPANYCFSDGTYYYTVAFVDEYFYENAELSSFINVDNRSMLLNPTQYRSSQDTQSSVIEDYAFEIQQRSIKSTYDLSVANPFGIETWDETGPTTWPYKTNLGSNGESGLPSLKDNSTEQPIVGYQNTKTFITHQGTDIDFTKVGYLSPVTSNDKSHHVWVENYATKIANNTMYLTSGYYSDLSYKINGCVVDNAIEGCIARNRDLNGNGVLDVETELKWYIPDLNQYLAIWFGEGLLYEDTRLYTLDALNSITDAVAMDRQPHYLTSSSSAAQRLYWQDQGAAWGPIRDWNALNSGGTVSANSMRCVRNLKTFNAEASFPATYDAETMTIKVEGVANLRTTTQIGAYGYHNERDAKNDLPRAFQVAKATTDLYNKSFTDDVSQDYFKGDFNTLASDYSEDTDDSDEGQWRIPNQRELALMYMLGVFEQQTNKRYYICSSTFFSQTSTGRYIPFVVDLTRDGDDADPTLSLPGSVIGNPNICVRFVRDVATSSSSTVEESDGGYSNGAGVEL